MDTETVTFLAACDVHHLSVNTKTTGGMWDRSSLPVHSTITQLHPYKYLDRHAGCNPSWDAEVKSDSVCLVVISSCIIETTAISQNKVSVRLHGLNQ